MISLTCGLYKTKRMNNQNETETDSSARRAGRGAGPPRGAGLSSASSELRVVKGGTEAAAGNVAGSSVTA